MTIPKPAPAADPVRPTFPHGYSPETAALLLRDLIKAIDLVNDGRTPVNTGIDPLVYAAEALAKALADALERAKLPGEVVT